MSFNYGYTIQFRDTDAAGVVYFANIISICHVAYEASLIESGIALGWLVNNADFAIPIASVTADFFKPMFCGDRVIIELTTQTIDSCKFEINYRILSLDRQVIIATATTKHVVIDRQTRKRKELPDPISDWLQQWCD